MTGTLTALTVTTARVQQVIDELGPLYWGMDDNSSREDIRAARGALEASKRLLMAALARETRHMEVPPANK